MSPMFDSSITVPGRRKFLSLAAATAWSSAFLPFGFLVPAQASGAGKADVNALVYPGFDWSMSHKGGGPRPEGPFVAVLGAGAAGTEAVRRLPSIWEEDEKHALWVNGKKHECLFRAPSSVHEFVAGVLESVLESDGPLSEYRCEPHRSPLSLLSRSDRQPVRLDLAVICCAFDDEPAFDRAANLAAVLAAHSVRTVMVGRPRHERSMASRGRPDSCGVNLGSLQKFRLLHIGGPPSASDRVEGSEMAAAANVFVSFIHSASLIGCDFGDFRDLLFHAGHVSRGASGENDGWPVIAGKDTDGSADDDCVDPAFRMDRWAVVSVTVPREGGARSLRDAMIERLRERQWPDHRWSPIYVSVGARPSTTLSEYHHMIQQMIEACGCADGDRLIAHTRFHTGEPDRLSVHLLALQVARA